MKPPAPNPLLRHLATAVVLKLLVLTVLWWAFVRDGRAGVDAEQAAVHLGGTPAAATAPPPDTGALP
ncbi:MAG: hypothetical protein IV093_06270 [Rubrivivax sp.]|nr:hypothetical protein [Rubrivivax sp.]